MLHVHMNEGAKFYFLYPIESSVIELCITRFGHVLACRCHLPIFASCFFASVSIFCAHV